MRTLTKTLLALALVVGLGACGDNDDGGASPTTAARATTSSSDPDSGHGDDATTTTAATSTPEGDGGEGSGTADEAAYAEAMATNLASGSSADGELDVTDEQAACVGPRWVSTIGIDAFVEADVAPADVAEDTFTPSDVAIEVEQGEAMVDALVDCDVDVFDQYFAVLSEGLSDDQVACLRTEFDDELARRFLAEALTQSEPSADLDATLQAVDETCQLSPS
jgi:hypothetical protein